MDTPRITINAITLLTLLLCGNHAMQAQGTAFTYQGRLNENGIPANGSYALKFSLFDAASGGSQVANSLTNAPTGVSEGLFTVVLDFGPGVFNGTALWLAIGVRTNGGSADFTTLSPRQPLTPNPYALYALNAGAAATANTATTAASADAVAAGNITGTIPDARLSPNVALLNGSPKFAGTVTATTFSGSGAGLTNVPTWSLSGAVDDTRLSANIARLNVPNTSVQATGTPIVTSGFITGATLIDGGSGYVTAPAVSINDATGSGAVITAAVSPEGVVTNVTVQNPGSGYSANATLTIAEPPSNAMQVFVGKNLFTNVNNVLVGSFTGNGGGLTNVNAAALNGLNSGAFAQLAASQGFNGANVFSNSANRFAGDGSGLINLNASALVSGAVNPARLSSVGALAGQVLKFNGSQVNWGQDNDTAYTVGPGLSLLGNQFSVNFAGSGTANSAARNDHNHDASYWRRGGNSGTAPGTDFIGTTDNQALEIKVNNARALRLEPTPNDANYSGIVNVLGGSTGNFVAAGVYAGTIAGGGAVNYLVDSTLFHPTNSVLGHFGTVVGGGKNTASGFAATVGGGSSNTASGQGATVPGGTGNIASGTNSFAAGRAAYANFEGNFVWNDSRGGSLSTTTSNSFAVKTTGGAYFITATNLNSSGLYSTGPSLNPGSGSWLSSSDRNAKENIAPIAPKKILEELVALQVSTWNWKAQENSIRHIGPMAQDFYVAFGVGEDDKHISTIDADGVALAAIQGLNQKVEEETAQLRREVDERDVQIEQLKQSLAEMRAVVHQLTQTRAEEAP